MHQACIARFWERVEKTETCWNWTGAANKTGHGVGWDGKRTRLAHRIAWFLAHGAWPIDCLCHRCDNPRCVRVDHLFEGTRADNLRDMREKNRGVAPPRFQGEGHPQTPLTVDDVRTIRSRAQRGNYSALGREYGVTPQAIRAIVNRRTWTHV